MLTSFLMTYINILIVSIWKSRQGFRSYRRVNMPLQADKLPISHNNEVGTVLQLNILETGVLTLVVQNSSPTRLRLDGDEFWTTCVRTPVSKMHWWIVCWSLASLCHSNGHIETMPAREINPFTALTRIRSQFVRTQWRAIISEWTRLRIRPLSHPGWLKCIGGESTIILALFIWLLEYNCHNSRYMSCCFLEQLSTRAGNSSGPLALLGRSCQCHQKSFFPSWWSQEWWQPPQQPSRWPPMWSDNCLTEHLSWNPPSTLLFVNRFYCSTEECHFFSRMHLLFNNHSYKCQYWNIESMSD